jgi:hypothetical protein
MVASKSWWAVSSSPRSTCATVMPAVAATGTSSSRRDNSRMQVQGNRGSLCSTRLIQARAQDSGRPPTPTRILVVRGVCLPVHFIQMWVLPDTERIDPGYQQLDINPELDNGGLVPIASGRGHTAAIAIRQKGAVLWGGRLKPGETVSVPDGQFVHIYIARGGATLENAGYLDKGDAVRLTAAGAPKLTADPVNGAEVLIWQTELPTRN